MEGDDFFMSKEDEMLFNAGPPKSIEEMNSDAIRNALSNLNFSHDKDNSIQSGTTIVKDTFTRLVPDQKAEVTELMPKRATDYQGTIPERLERISRELGKIEKEVKAMEEARSKQKTKKVDFEAKALNEVEKIKKRVGELVMSKGYQELIQWEGETAGLHSTGLNEKLTESLIGTINAIAEDKKEKTGEGMKCELYYSDYLHRMQDTNRFIELEKRINKLENAIGDWKESPEFVNMTQTVEYLYQMMQYVNPNLADEKLRGLEKLIAELKSVVTQKRDTKLLSFDKGEIESLYEVSQFALNYYKTLPSIIEKLNGLKYIHDQSASLLNRVLVLEKNQDDIDYMMKQTKELVEDAKGGLDKSIVTLQSNMKSLDERLAKVLK